MRIFIAPALALAITVGGCATTGTPSSIVAEVQAIATQVCAYVPTAETVLNILGAGIPGLTNATAIADAICKAVTKPTARRGASRPTVAGVAVRGHFVGKR